MGLVVGEVTAMIGGDTSGFQSSLNSAQSMGSNFIGQIGDTFKQFGQSMVSLGSDLTKYVTVPLTGAAIAVFKFGKDFETELSKVVGLVGVSKSQVDEWGSEILDLAPKLGKAPRELAEALFFVTSAGIRGAEAMDVLEMSAKASAAGLGETKTIADLVTSAMNAYGKENLSAATATDIVTAAVREGKAEASDLAATMGAVLPLASEMGISFDQVAATQAAMTKTGTDAHEAATQLKSIMAGLIKPSKGAKEQLEAMGTSASKMRKKIKDEGLLKALMDLREMTNKYGEEAMAKVFPNIRGLMGVLDLMGNNLEGNKETFDKVKNSMGMLDEAFKATSDTLDFKWNAALGEIQATAIKFFDVLKKLLLPVLEKFSEVLKFVADKFAALSMPIKLIIAGFLGVVASIGPVLIVIGTIITAIGGFISTIGGLVAVITVLIAFIDIVGPIIAILAGVFIVVGVAIVGVIAVVAGLVASFIHLFKTNEEFRNNVLKTWNVIKENAKIIFNEIKDTILYIFQKIKALWAKHGDEIMAVAKKVWDLILVTIRIGMYLIRDIVKLVSAIIKGDWRNAWDSIKSITKTLIVGIGIIVERLKGIMRSAFQAAARVAIEIFDKMIRRIVSLASTLVKVGIRAGNALISGFKQTNLYQAGVNLIQSFINGIKAMIGKAASAAASVAKAVRNFFPFSPAKVGPLKDIHKMNFAGPILKSLGSAENEIKNNFLGSVILSNGSKTSSGFGSSNIGGSIGNNFSGDLNFYGIKDMGSFLDEMRRFIQKYGGGF
jgi:TP901 family phage tail tape measure protein